MADSADAAKVVVLYLIVLVLFIATLCASIGPWLWIRFSKGIRASAWGAAEEATERPQAEPLSASYERSLRGRPAWVRVLLILFSLPALVLLGLSRPSGYITISFAYILCFLPACLLLLFAFQRIGKPRGVEPGLLALFFIQGALLGCLAAGALELVEQLFWRVLSPNCNMMNMNVRILYDPQRRRYEEAMLPLSADCGFLSALMWISVPGLVEETSKAVWLFFRLRRCEQDLPSSCCFCFPASGAFDCGCWFKLAPTPYHVLLCALAAGAGFESFENVKYAFSMHLNPVTMASTRMMTSCLHMAWTGLIGHGLARKMFLPTGKQPSLLAVVLPVVVLHGLFDFASAALQGVAQRVHHKLMEQALAMKLELLFLLLLLLTCSGSYLVACERFGLRCCPRRCCCSLDFWEADYAQAREEVSSPPLMGTAVGVERPLLLAA